MSWRMGDARYRRAVAAVGAACLLLGVGVAVLVRAVRLVLMLRRERRAREVGGVGGPTR